MKRSFPIGITRRRAAQLALLGLLAGLTLALTQCKMVADQLSSVKVSAENDAGSCIAACAHAFNDSLRVESDLHVANVHACAGDTVCLAAEGARHDAAVVRIQQGRNDCQRNCHHQGGGDGGR